MDATDETVDKVRDLMIVQLDGWGLTIRDIGRIIGMPKSTVHYRLKTIPEDARRYYEKSLRKLDRPAVLG